MRYLVSGRELDNFTFDIDNRQELEAFIANGCGFDEADVHRAVAELDGDRWLRDEIDRKLAMRRDREPHMEYGRRLGWYAVTRLIRPSLVVETGVHDGLGSTVFLRALERNAADGAEGRLLSFDVRDDVGWLVPDRLRPRHELVIGDSVREMARAVRDRNIDVFLHDSLHTYQHETAELELALRHAEPHAILMSDNAAVVPAMEDFCARHGLPFDLFVEVARDHFYPGAGLGLTSLGRQ
jgi:hypothetical protein